MDRPIQEQVDEFWGWCGYNLEHRWVSGTQYKRFRVYCTKCGVEQGSESGIRSCTPPVDLNNLFKYAVPELTNEQRYAVLFFWIGQVDKGKDPALALFWAIYKEIGMDDLARRLLVEQTRKEVLDEIKKYQVGWAENGGIIATKTTNWEGCVFIIPLEKCKELFKEMPA